MRRIDAPAAVDRIAVVRVQCAAVVACDGALLVRLHERRQAALAIRRAVDVDAGQRQLHGRFAPDGVAADFIHREPGAAVTLPATAVFHRDGRTARFYTIVSRDTVDADFAQNRQRFLAEQGYAYRIIDAGDLAAEA